MGIAAYQRGTLVIRRQADEEAAEVSARMDLSAFRSLARDADRLQVGVTEMAERFQYFAAAGWWREARAARLRGLHYRRLRSKIIARLKSQGFEVQQ